MYSERTLNSGFSETWILDKSMEMNNLAILLHSICHVLNEKFEDYKSEMFSMTSSKENV